MGGSNGLSCVLLISMVLVADFWESASGTRTLLLTAQHGSVAGLQGQLSGATKAAKPAGRRLHNFLPFSFLPMSGFPMPINLVALGDSTSNTPSSSQAPSNSPAPDSGSSSDMQTQFRVQALPVLNSMPVPPSNIWKIGKLVEQGSEVPVDQELKNALYTTNFYRSLHGVPLVTWNKQYAEDLAKTASSCSFTPSADSSTEDNIAWGYTNFGQVVQAWYGEAARYDYNSDTVPPEFQHFARMIWRDVKQIGCAYSLNCRVYVCRYSPVQVGKGGAKDHVQPVATSG